MSESEPLQATSNSLEMESEGSASTALEGLLASSVLKTDGVKIGPSVSNTIEARKSLSSSTKPASIRVPVTTVERARMV